MSELKQETGYAAAKNVSAKPLNGTIPGTGRVMDWSKGDLKSLFVEPAAKAPSLKQAGPTATKPENEQQPKAQKEEPTAKAASNDRQAQSNNQPDNNLDDDRNDLAQAKPAPAPETTKLKTPVTIPAQFAPVMAAGTLTALQQEAAADSNSTGLSTDMQDKAEFQLGTSSRAAMVARFNQAEQERHAEADAKASSSVDMIEQYYAQQHAQFMRDMDRFIYEERNRLENEAVRHEKRIAELDKEIITAEADRDRTFARLEENKERVQFKDQEITDLQIKEAQTTKELQELEKKKAENDQEIEKQEQKVDATAVSASQAEEAAKTAGEAVQVAEEEVKNLAQAKEIYKQEVRKAEERVAKLQEELAKDEQKILRDEAGNSVYQDKQGNLYIKNADGSSKELSAESQKALKEKQNAAGLITANDIEEKRQQLSREEETLSGMKEGVKAVADLKETADVKKDNQKANHRFLQNVAQDINNDLQGHKDKLEALKEENNRLKEEIKEKKDQLESIKDRLNTATTDKQQLLQEQAKLEEELRLKNQRVADLKDERKEEISKLKEVKRDIKALDDFNEKRNDPKMKARLESPDPAVRKAAYKELLEDMPEGLRERFKEQRAELEKERAAKASKTPESNADSSATNMTATKASVDNTSRINGSASEPTVSASTTLGPPFAAAASGAPATPAAPEPETPAPEVVASNQQKYNQGGIRP